MDPRPVAGSQPVTAEKPCRQHVAYLCEFNAPHLLFPRVMSFTNADGFVYKAGLTQPNDPLPAARRAALMLEKNPATTGADADVPYKLYALPPIITR